MYKWVVFMVVFMCSVVFADSENWNGYGDSSKITTFKADSLKYTKIFPLSKFENIRVTLYLDDASSDGFASDSVNAIWGIQVGHPGYYNTTGNISRQTITWGEEVTIDTFDMLTAGNFVKSRPVLASDGTFNNSLKFIDSITVSGKAYQTRAISPDWDVYIRGWIKGGTGNKTLAFLTCIFEFDQRTYLPTRNR